ncbi:mucin-2 [Petaurus breviceps papuanus]|uniref:mucin-2 n=1 Tax=Petaurus breviceps papuanus TaxID=3040969 RepID=UPI0036DBF7AC
MGLSPASLLAVWLALSSAGASDLQKGRSLNHGHNVCSTWGNNHYKTFDGDIYQFPGLCDYNFASDCRGTYKEFAVHTQRGLSDDHHPQITYILVTIKDVTIYLTHQLVVVNGAIVHVPYYSSGLLIEKNDVYTKIYARGVFALMWNLQDSLMLELDSEFRNHTCGLCGDYNGRQTYSEFNNEGITFSPIEFGNMQKINQPEAVCEDPEDKEALESCSEHRAQCEDLLMAAAFEDCQAVVPVEMYIQACMQDLCQCEQNTSFCLCSTVSEFSRQCSHAGGRPHTWRTDTFCPKTCPDNMVYLESGSPCMDTCSHLEVSSLCEEHYVDGCFCPEGTVYDDITGKGCIQVNECSCKLHGHLYAPGKQISSNCEECVCNAGRWVCEDLSCPGTCALEGGAHITTFDGKKYTFHGDCYYILAKGDSNDSYALLGELAPCGSTDKQTCLKTVVLLTDNKKNIVAFKSDGSVLLNELEVHLPHITASFSIFQPSSYHLIVHTAYGLKLQIQLVPVMQLFMTMDQAFQGKVQGLCGNFNGLESDDFKTAGGLIEATGSGFANTWKAQSNCHDKLDWLDDPCSLSIENANYAEHWCSLLKQTEAPFARCHSVVDPVDYYKRCKYDTCNCQNNEDCMCAALSSYARACSTKGVMLWGWREQVCNRDVTSCPNSQVFLYNLTTCQQTCRSLSEVDKHCLKGFAPVDGCGCPDSTYMDEKGRCVSLSKCSCYHKGLYLEAGEVVLKQDERCVCRNGRLHCIQVKLIGQSCASPKIHVDCDNLTALTTQMAHPISCQNLESGYYQTECVSGCMCPPGLIDDGRGGCVMEEECPCVHNKELYLPGQKISVDCNTCTCQRGSWACTKSLCHGTCSIYGSGHYVTFDGKYYDFDGHCSYVAAQDYCGQKDSQGSFSIITENVPCGTTGVTCSKAIKIFLGRTELKLEEKRRWVIQRAVGEHVSYTTREVGQYLVIEASSGIIVIWDKRTTVFIKLAPSFKGTVCGLCGNFDDRSSNDFTTRDHMIVTSVLDFGNSWKEAHTCPDVDQTFEPCTVNPHRESWAEKQCSILKSQVFSVCHSKVDPAPFYDACVHDSCSCDTGGDCECFCSAVASYAQECTKEGACVFWRSPDLCPIFCDYYNPPHECEWHYEPCGNRSFETCRTINNIHSNISVSYLEGCYPRCPPERPIFDEDKKKCVPADKCGCYVDDEHYDVNEKVPTENVCQSCICTPSSEVSCKEDIGAIINQTQDGSFCFWELCGPNGTVTQYFNICAPTSSPITLPVSTTSVTTTSPTTTLPTTSTTTTSTVSLPSTTPKICCFWSDWINEDHPTTGSNDGDWERFDGVCRAPEDIECRSAEDPHLSSDQLGQKVQCDTSFGFICKNEDQFENGPFGLCYDYEIRVNCCLPMDHCPESTPSTTITPVSTTTVTPVTTTGRLTPSTPTTIPTISSTTTTETPTVPTSTSTPTTTITTETPKPTPTTTTTETPTPTPTSTTTPTTTSASTETPTPTTCQSEPVCDWTDWVDSGKPDFGTPGGGDFELVEDICKDGWAENITCRAAMYPDHPIAALGQVVVCDASVGLVCKNEDQKPGVIPMAFCLNYEVKVYCCEQSLCTTRGTTTSTTATTVTPTLTPTITTTITETPTPTPTTSTTTTTPETPTPTPHTTTSATPTPSTTTATETSTPTVTPTTTPETPTSTPYTTTPETATPTPHTTTSGTPTPSTTTTTETSTPTPTPITTTTTTTPETPTPTPYTTTPETATTTPHTTTSATPTPSTTTTTETSTPTVTPTTTTPETPTPHTTTPEALPLSSSTSEIPTPTLTTSSTLETPTPYTTSAATTTETPTSSKTHTTPATTTGTETPNPILLTTTKETRTTTITEAPTVTTSEIPSSITTETPTPTGTTGPGTGPSAPTLTVETTTTMTRGAPSPSTPTSAPTFPETTATVQPPPSTTRVSVPTTARTTSTSGVTARPLTPPMVSSSTSMGTTETTASQESCCVLNDTYYQPGDVVYNGRYGDYCFYVNCSMDCKFEFFNWSCPSTPQPTPTPTATPTPTPSKPTTPSAPTPSKPTTPSPGCPDFVPPRQENETWWLCNCTMAVCKHDNTVEIFEKVCDPPPKPVCSNGLNPVWVLDPDGCCGHWECDCYCTGWGDPHYTTFDGLYYSYQGNCTYVLVEEISPTVDNFGIYIDNYHCDVNDKVSCPRTLIVRHETQEVLIKTIQMAPMKVQVLVNQQAVGLPYQKYGLQVYEAGINYVVEIAELGVLVSYNGLSFAIRMPYTKFGNNTKGQCGTCTNDTTDDCMLPSGEVISDCEIMADEWVVNDPSKPHCPHISFTTRSPSVTKPGVTAIPSDCIPSPLCELIKDSLFAKCHKYAPPQHYYDACVFDSCFVPDSGMECASLQTYAALCAQEGICISWREHTDGVCDVTCPSHKEYKACGPAEEPTCKSSSEASTDNRTMEGCFCPDGTISFAPGVDVCVQSCGCVGPDSVPREFGERFEFDCKNCICLEGGSGIVCEAKQCSQQKPQSCQEEGTYPVTEVDPSNTCCNITSCKCNTSLCQTKLPVCSVGFELKTQLISGKCCPVHTCEPKGVCVLGEAEYKPGSPVYSEKCQECVCTKMVNASTQLNVISCSPVPCNTSCQPGFEPVKVSDQCCPKCEQTQCVMHQTGSLMLLKPGEMKNDPKDNCTIYSCMKLQDQLISSVSEITCPDLDLGSCQPGTIKLMPNGCCKTCEYLAPICLKDPACPEVWLTGVGAAGRDSRTNRDMENRLIWLAVRAGWTDRMSCLSQCDPSCQRWAAPPVPSTELPGPWCGAPGRPGRHEAFFEFTSRLHSRRQLPAPEITAPRAPTSRERSGRSAPENPSPSFSGAWAGGFGMSRCGGGSPGVPPWLLFPIPPAGFWEFLVPGRGWTTDVAPEPPGSRLQQDGKGLGREEWDPEMVPAMA